MVEITLLSQIWLFISSVIFGVALSIIYDFFCVLKLMIKCNNILKTICDIIYFVFISILTFIFLLIFNFGEVRIFILIGMLVGWWIYHYFIGRLNVSIINRIVCFINHVFLKLRMKIAYPIVNTIKNLARAIIKKIATIKFKKIFCANKNMY